MSAPIVFFDIAGPDAAQLKNFYAQIFGWSIDAALAIDAASTGGLRGTLRQDPAEKILYLGTSDINAVLAQITKAGGSVDVPRMVVPGVVTFALFRDPAGNRMGLVETTG
jgi:predicted enzyme related to lactoylglutathione lyase